MGCKQQCVLGLGSSDAAPNNWRCVTQRQSGNSKATGSPTSPLAIPKRTQMPAGNRGNPDGSTLASLAKQLYAATYSNRKERRVRCASPTHPKLQVPERTRANCDLVPTGSARTLQPTIENERCKRFPCVGSSRIRNTTEARTPLHAFASLSRLQHEDSKGTILEGNNQGRFRQSPLPDSGPQTFAANRSNSFSACRSAREMGLSDSAQQINRLATQAT
jgi:hypothetical protein